MIKIKVTGEKKVIAYLDKLERDLDGGEIKRLNKQRGYYFRSLTQKWTRNDDLGLLPISPATIILRESSGGTSPMKDTGALLNAMDVHVLEKSTKVGYFPGGEKSSKQHPGSANASNKSHRLKMYQVAKIHHVLAGYKIPVTLKMTQYLASRGVPINPDKKHINVAPGSGRPFMYKAVDRYVDEGKDEILIRKFIKKVFYK